jgi:hypothetical protein
MLNVRCAGRQSSHVKEVHPVLFHHTGEGAKRQGQSVRTAHGFLVYLGEIVSQLKVRELLVERVRVKQKTLQFTPADKLMQALLGILSGCRYMKDLTFGANLLSQDAAVSKAWGLSGMAHFSTVCTTLAKMTTANVEELVSALGQVTRPWLQEAIRKAAGPDGKQPVVIDVDLTGQRVGPDSRITGTAFGYMDGKLAKGYQIAAAFLAGSADRLAVAAALKPGNSRSVPCLMELLPRIEAQIGRPRRRVEWMEFRLGLLKQQKGQWQSEYATASGKGAANRRITLAKLIQEVQEEIDYLEPRIAQYRRDNAEGNFTPYRLVLRADSAFGTPEALRHCLEMGYEVLIKAAHGAMYPHLFKAIPEDQWETDTKNRQVTSVLSLPPSQLPPGFEVRQIAMRHHDREGKEVRAVLVTSLTEEEFPLHKLLKLYRQRQSIEAGFQQCKGTFHFGAPRLRSEAANAAFTQLVVFAYNLVRWCRNLVRDALPSAKTGVRFLVWVAANAPARVSLALDGTTRVIFSKGTALAGVSLIVPLGP